MSPKTRLVPSWRQAFEALRIKPGRLPLSAAHRGSGGRRTQQGPGVSDHICFPQQNLAVDHPAAERPALDRALGDRKVQLRHQPGRRAAVEPAPAGRCVATSDNSSAPTGFPVDLPSGNLAFLRGTMMALRRRQPHDPMRPRRSCEPETSTSFPQSQLQRQKIRPVLMSVRTKLIAVRRP